ncbi:hypothetical protein BDW02DRAFT_473363, partial [Decorospora gaudefroyi]
PPSSAQPLPSLLRYTDHDLMANAHIHNQPPNPHATCPICMLSWYRPIPSTTNMTSQSSATATRSTFLPLTPCGHWLHYRCLIQQTTHQPAKTTCPTCHTPLYAHEGITVLTLTTRTRLAPPGLTDPNLHTDLSTIDAIVSHHFFHQLNLPSPFADRSPQLVHVYHRVMNDLAARRLPQSVWLGFSTEVGYLLFGVFVGVRMERWLGEGHGGIVGTEGWCGFEVGRAWLRVRVLGAVHG